MQDIMLEIMRLADEKDYDGLRELRQAYRGFEAINPRRGTDEELDGLVDGNLYFLCDVADRMFRITEAEPHLTMAKGCA